jgi:NADPH:quinone reductase-like Zn-dependent oxidoreductase
MVSRGRHLRRVTFEGRKLPGGAERLAKDRDEIFALAAAKKYRAFVSRTFPAAEVADATRHLESGKVVLTF